MISSAISSAASGMQAQQTRLAGVASNVANARTVGATAARTAQDPQAPQAYQPVQTVQQSAVGGGTRASLALIDPATMAQYQPDSAAADADGMVEAPLVDPVEQTVERLRAGQAYKAGASVVRTADSMLGSLLDAVDRR
jgi:flagellar basal-body rod protein FlgC